VTVTAPTTAAPDLQPHDRGYDTYGDGNALGSNTAALISEEPSDYLATSPSEGRRGRLCLDLGKSGYELLTGLLDLILKGLRGTGIAHEESLAARSADPHPWPYCDSFAVT
jgi:hypothetical protein